MAAVRSRANAPVGSTQWVLEERIQVNEFIEQEIEDFQFSAHNDMEWLNEHMADIFTRSQLYNNFFPEEELAIDANESLSDVAEAFKTPGKLRGKTPRSARRRGLEDRAPLTDVFTSDSHGLRSPSRTTPFMKKITHFKVAEDKDDSHLNAPIIEGRYPFGHGKENCDSGYHGMTDDETMNNGRAQTSQHQPAAQLKPRYILSPPKQRAIQPLGRSPTEPIRDESQDTFISATEDVPSQPTGTIATATQESKADEAMEPDEELDETVKPAKASAPDGQITRTSNQYSVSISTAEAMDDALEIVELESPERQPTGIDEASPSSDASSEHRPILRKKSSLTFASLPPRAPMTAQKSLGDRNSRTSHVDQARPMARSSHIAQHVFESAQFQGPNVEEPQDLDEDRVYEGQNLEQSSVMSEAGKAHSQTSTQRLQERLALLGKSTAPRISKSIPSLAARPSNVEKKATQSQQEDATPAVDRDDDDDSWISPPADGVNRLSYDRHTASPGTASGDGIAQMLDKTSPKIHSESLSSSADHAQAPNLTYPTLPESRPEIASSSNAVEVGSDRPEYPRLQIETSSTGATAPNRHDGPLSASKAKLFSVFKSAKGMFASSASASAQAKMNTASPRLPASNSQASLRSVGTFDTAMDEQQVDTRNGAVNVKPGSHNAAHNTADLSKDLPDAPKRTSDRLKAAKILIPDDATHSEEKTDNISSARPQAEFEDMSRSAHEGPPPPPPKQPQQEQKVSELRKPGGRMTRDPAQKPRPAPVSIKLRGFQGPGMGAFSTGNRQVNASQSHEPSAPNVPPKQPTLSKNASTSSMASSAQSFKTTATSRPKALEAAARKKEQDEREAQRKAEQRHDLERRRAAKAEEERKAEQDRKMADQKANDEKQQALRQAAEQRKIEAIKRNEQTRVQAADTLHAAQYPSTNQNRADLGTKPLSRLASNADLSRPAMPHLNPAKPPKRQSDADGEGEVPARAQTARSAPGPPASKRRRTSEDSFAEVITRPTMAPPVRPSMKRPETINRPVPTSFASSSAQMQQPQSMVKTATFNQHHIQHPKTPHMNDLAKFSNAKIPFAVGAQTGPSYSQQPQTSRQTHQFKTPGTAKTHKSSPQYPNGDNISLPEIATDSEDSDGEDDFTAPDWANSPELRELLRQQQLVDPMKVFGPIAPLMMEEMFKGNKERQAKFRKRTSSANWNGPDRLTEDERRKDQAAREKLEKDGAWTFGTPT